VTQASTATNGEAGIALPDGGWLVGVDSGGTFTDLVALEPASGAFRVAKVPSTPEQPVDGVLAVLERPGITASFRRAVHGTTVATNALLERKGARICLLATAGFEDVAFIQRLNRPYAFNLFWKKPKPLVRRRHCIGVRERVDARGEVVEALSPAVVARVVAAVRGLADAGEIDAVAVCLLFSYLNDSHELALEHALQSALPRLPISLSSRISPLWREYERVSTALADAYVRPLMTGYLGQLSIELEQRFGGISVLVLKSNGGTASVDSVIPAPVSTLLSGLAGGAVGGAYFAGAVGETRCVTFDMGGTSTDIGLVQDGAVGQLTEYEIEWGLPVATSVVDVHTIGAGGGSIARVDLGGLLRVGPESAGASPGPACYGLGGEQPTVTDANLVLGRLDPSYFLGGEMRLDLDAAHRALERLGARVSMSAQEVAHAIIEIANENMADAIRLVTIERGIDPREHALVAFGGAGPLHACGVADAVGMTKIVVPPHPGLCSAFGAAIAVLRVDNAWSLGARADATSEDDLRSQFLAAEARARAELERDGAQGRVDARRSIACRYYLQNYEQDVVIGDLEPGFLDRVCARFHGLHHAFYGYSFEGDPVELVHCKLTVIEAEGPAATALTTGVYGPAEELGTRPVASADGRIMTMPIVRRGRLEGRLEGPLVIEESDSTVFVTKGWSVAVADADCLILTRNGGGL
jgi:N-methylhydantoinase A